MTIPHHTHQQTETTLWIYTIGTMYTSKLECMQTKDRTGAKETMKAYEFYGKTWYILHSAWSLRDSKKAGYQHI